MSEIFLASDMPPHQVTSYITTSTACSANISRNHSASESGFKVSGVFRDAADFAVLVLWDRDDFFGHPRFSYLPDGDFSGITLTFDLAYQNLQPIDSPKFATIDWPYLNCLKTDGSLVQLRLFDRATQVGGTYTAASGTFTLVDNGLQPYDRVTLWYQNLAFDYIVPDPATGVTAASIVANIRDQINNTNWVALGVLIPLSATSSGNQLTIAAQRAGYDGNMIRLYELHKNSNLYFTPSVMQLAGGSSDATWRITINFSTEGRTDLQKIWLTFAPRLADSAAYQDQEWEATLTNWSVSDPQGKRPLKVAGPLSVRIEENDAWVRYSGFWEWAPAQFWSQGRARRAAQAGATATVETTAMRSTTSTSAPGSTSTAASSRYVSTAGPLCNSTATNRPPRLGRFAGRCSRTSLLASTPSRSA
jgi:hypothetical protein